MGAGSGAGDAGSWVVLTRALTRNQNTNAVITDEDPASASVSEASVSGFSVTNKT